MKTTYFDEIINSISGKYDAFTVEETEGSIAYTLVSNSRSDFQSIKSKLKEYVGDIIYINGKSSYSVSTSDDLGLNRITFKRIS
ncbi:hypothetical protein [Alkalibacter mobilis]|uniref:hypothetical protein n=1 Tax=Alkalibacter mobilis TaxID=2787712 RepID=UPI00189E3E18|nr:hypothetical protein [Alkalibacter mobilis]MBF7096046.1 hypothetical protein [Alkalibacter mobilis]